MNSKPLQRVVLPPEVKAGWEKKLGLKKWVDRKEWAEGPRYLMVEAARASWESVDRKDFADDPETLVGSMYPYLVNDQEFTSFVGETQVVTEASVWNEIAKAYAWVILQRYNRELGGDND